MSHDEKENCFAEMFQLMKKASIRTNCVSTMLCSAITRQIWARQIILHTRLTKENSPVFVKQFPMPKV
jgi:hypothetical protein